MEGVEAKLFPPFTPLKFLPISREVGIAGVGGPLDPPLFLKFGI